MSRKVSYKKSYKNVSSEPLDHANDSDQDTRLELKVLPKIPFNNTSSSSDDHKTPQPHPTPEAYIGVNSVKNSKGYHNFNTPTLDGNRKSLPDFTKTDNGLTNFQLDDDKDTKSPKPKSKECEEFISYPWAHDIKNFCWPVYFFPFLYWLPRYKISHWLCHDIIAGLTVAIMNIPKSMTYGLLAGLLPVNGLYGAMIGPLTYFFMGTSGQLVVVPAAVVTLMTADAVNLQIDDSYFVELQKTGVKEHDIKVALAGCVAIQVGLIQVLLGFLRAGIFATFLSHSVIVGFISAAAIIIGTSQLKHVFNLYGSGARGGTFITTIAGLIKRLPDTHMNTLIMSVLCMLILIIFKQIKKKCAYKEPLAIPSLRRGSSQSDRSTVTRGEKICNSIRKGLKFLPIELFIVCGFTLYSAKSAGGNPADAANIHPLGFKIVGSIQSGLPQFGNPFSIVPMNIFMRLWLPAMFISIIQFVQSYAVGYKFAEEKNYEINVNQELRAYGLINIVVAFFKGWAVAGSVSASTVNTIAGSMTPVSQIVTGLALSLCLLFAMHLFYYLPLCILGSIVVVAVSNLINISEVKYMYKISKKDFLVCFFTFLSTLVFGVELGVGIGVFTSILMFVTKVAKTNFQTLFVLSNPGLSVQNLNDLNESSNENGGSPNHKAVTIENINATPDLISSPVFSKSGDCKVFGFGKSDIPNQNISPNGKIYDGNNNGSLFLANCSQFTYLDKAGRFNFLSNDPNRHKTSQETHVLEKYKKLADQERYLGNVKNDIIIWEWNTSIFFANVENFKSTLRGEIVRFKQMSTKTSQSIKYPNEGPTEDKIKTHSHLSDDVDLKLADDEDSVDDDFLWCLIVKIKNVYQIDVTAAIKLEKFFKMLKKNDPNMSLYLVGVNRKIKKILNNANIQQTFDQSFDHISQAQNEWRQFKNKLNDLN